ncbi:MAG: hypothetical protein ACMG6E_09650 [Candidatus Roizmanbacteria bacterium]
MKPQYYFNVKSFKEDNVTLSNEDDNVMGFGGDTVKYNPDKANSEAEP